MFGPRRWSSLVKTLGGETPLHFHGQADHLPGWSAAVNTPGNLNRNMKLLIAAAFAAFALVACDEHETNHVKSGTDHIKAASEDYREAASSAADRAYHAASGAPRELRESAADLADKTADALRK